MKKLLAVVGGFLVSLGMFAGGLAAAIYMLAVEPQAQLGPSVEVAELWTAEPRKIDRNAQQLERIPVQPPATANQPAEPEVETTAAAAEAAGSVDATTTASVQTAAADARQDRLLPPPQEEQFASQDAEQPVVADELNAAHMDWCASRYRSYRPDDDSYTSFSGLQQPCVSPYSRDLGQEVNVEPALGSPPNRAAEAEFVDGSDSYPAFVEEASAVQYAVDDTAAYAGSDHESYCFSRYRSYRPQDNTYQPFGGGPRQQCR